MHSVVPQNCHILIGVILFPGVVVVVKLVSTSVTINRSRCEVETYQEGLVVVLTLGSECVRSRLSSFVPLRVKAKCASSNKSAPYLSHIGTICGSTSLVFLAL